MNAARISFPGAVSALLVAMLASVLAGCVTAPERNRNGDFVSHMASTETGARGTAQPDAVSAPRA